MGLTLSREPPAQGDLHEANAALLVNNFNRSSKHLQQNHHVRQASVRSRAVVPMPDNSELDKRFAKVLVSGDIFISTKKNCRYFKIVIYRP